jgi:hypothetical protein
MTSAIILIGIKLLILVRLTVHISLLDILYRTCVLHELGAGVVGVLLWILLGMSVVAPLLWAIVILLLDLTLSTEVIHICSQPIGKESEIFSQ